jgi:hypothetical protein
VSFRRLLELIEESDGEDAQGAKRLRASTVREGSSERKRPALNAGAALEHNLGQVREMALEHEPGRQGRPAYGYEPRENEEEKPEPSSSWIRHKISGVVRHKVDTGTMARTRERPAIANDTVREHGGLSTGAYIRLKSAKGG